MTETKKCMVHGRGRSIGLLMVLSIARSILKPAVTCGSDAEIEPDKDE